MASGAEQSTQLCDGCWELETRIQHEPHLAGKILAELQRRPKIVCLCGSTRFYKAFQEANYRETMAGNIVLSVGFYMHASGAAHGETWGCTPDQKVALDELHFRKIELADEVLVLNVNGYIGQSTSNELNHARSLGKHVRFLEEPGNA